ncbi:hypothetical protein L6V77_05595 [Myxococcota bacterium]|jgi:mRNA-degrading endonuclease YafQ of YafQ-DinJ toxin-antitoxin module|nr:hypothetical protein [Myxococcota bacterium]
MIDNEFVQGLMEKVGLDEEKAKQVIAFLQENAHKLPEWLKSSELVDNLKDKLPGGIGKLFG